MLTFYDSQNQPVKLVKELGRGGEGIVYLSENEAFVGKIYHEPVSPDKAEKLRWMAAHKSARLLKTTVWLTDVLRDKPGGKIAGFLMPKIRAKEIHELYSPKSRRIHFPDATWHFLIHTATNIARAFNNLHREGHVMGDVNQGNCVVTADGLVKLIDCDSYEIKAAEKTFPCEVGVTTHIPPELQGKNLREIDRTENHDNFGLAVIIFQLLFLGRHPFAGNYLGADDKPIEDAIREYLFVYGRDAEKKRVVRPPGTPPLMFASSDLAELFERAFSKENLRPKPYEWIEALENLAENLRQCLLNPGHVFYSKLAVCPWCEIEEETGLILFPFTVSGNALSKRYERDFKAETVEKLIESFGISSTQSFLRKIPTVKPAASVIKERQRLNRMILISVGLSILYLVLSYFAAAGFGLWFVIIVITVAFSNKAAKEFRQEERRRYEELKSEREYFENVFSKSASADEITKELNKTKIKLGQYNLLKSAQTSPYAENFGEDVGKQAGQLESDITALLISLRSSSVKLRRHKQKFLAKTQENLKNLARARANVKHLGREIPLPQIIVISSFILSFFLPSYHGSEPKKNKTFSIQSLPTPQPTPPSPSLNIPESLSDKQISWLPADQRKLMASFLLEQTELLSSSSRDTTEKEKKLKLALRLDDKNVEVLNALGKLSYDKTEYRDAEKYLMSAQIINSETADKFYLGMSRLQLEKFKEAGEIFAILSDKNPTGPAFYNLGSAQFGLNDYKSAAESYRKAIELNKYDNSAIYQRGICLNKLGDREGVKEVYATLWRQAYDLSQTFRKEVGKTVNLEVIPTDYPSDLSEKGEDDTAPPPPFVNTRKPN